MQWTRHWPYLTNRRRDDDNLNASLKHARDGIAHAGLIKNDAGFSQQVPTQVVVAVNHRVELRLLRIS